MRLLRKLILTLMGLVFGLAAIGLLIAFVSGNNWFQGAVGLFSAFISYVCFSGAKSSKNLGAPVLRPGAKASDMAFVDVSTNAITPPSRSFHSKVVGVTYSNADGANRQDIIKLHCQIGQVLRLEPEPTNPKDSNAVGVWIPQGQIGYLESGRVAADISQRLRNLQQVTAEISTLTGGTKDAPTRGINIEIHLFD